MHLLVVTAVDEEARAIGPLDGAVIVVGGIGRTNAAAATTQGLLRREAFDAVLSAGVAGALPGSELEIGAVVAASACIYVEEGLATPGGFADVEAMGLALGDFAGNRVPVDDDLLEVLAGRFPVGPVATVATCSGTDEAAAEVVRRTGAVAEAMEGAAVVHAARRLGVPAIELRAISNRTGRRDRQGWNLDAALAALGPAVRTAHELLGRSESSERP
jgi:futalosine hydrolase